MPGWTSPVSVRSDPRKAIYYLYYRLMPFLPSKSELLEDLPRSRFEQGYLRNILEEEICLVEDALEVGSKKWKYIAAQEITYRHNALVAKNLDSIKDKRIWWFTGESPNQSEGRKRLVGHDPIAQDFELSNILVSAIKELDEDFQKETSKPLGAYKADLFMFMTDFMEFVKIPSLYPKSIVSYYFKEVFEQVNREMQARNKKGFGSLEKEITKEPLVQQPNSDFHTSVLSSELAKSLLLHDGIIGEDRRKQIRDIDATKYICAFLFSAAYTSPEKGLWSRLGLNKINVYAIKGSEIYQAVIKSPYASNFKITESELMRRDEAKKSGQREISPSAIKILKNNFKCAWFPKRKQIVQHRLC